MKRILSLVTALLLLLPLASCGDSAADGQPGEVTMPPVSVPADQTTPETSAETARTPCGLPEEYDLEGYVMTYYGAKLEPGTYQNNMDLGVFSAEQTGDLIGDAAYLRDAAVMEKYNCVIDYKDCTDLHPISTVKPVILAGDSAYDVILEGAGYMTSLASEGMIADMNSLEWLDTTAPWWLQTVNESLTVAGRLYATIGSHMIRTKTFLYTVIFNHKLCHDLGIDTAALYGAALDGSWTMDMLYDNAKTATIDLNGDSVLDNRDQWGIAGECYNAYTMAFGAGVDYVTPDADGIPTVSVNTEKNISVITDVLDMLTDTGTTLISEQIKGVDSVWNEVYSMMGDDRVLFFLGQANTNTLRGMESDYGYLPSPKYTEAQDGYRHTTSVYNATSMMIPVSCADAETVGFIQEAVCWESYYSFLPVFYENFLQTKIARDQETIDILEIIHNSIYYDLCGIIAFSSIPGVIRGVAETGTGADSFVSKLAANESSANKTIRDTIDKILEH